jgi:adenylylsulfate kinase-like enzyme
MGTDMNRLPILWFTGQPGAGKTTLAEAFAEEIELPTEVFTVDGDELRAVLGNPGYGEDGRRQNIKNAQNIALFAQSKGFLVVVSLIAPYRTLREELKAKTKICEVYVHTSQERGRESFFVAGYEPPCDNFLDLDTGIKTLKECLDEVRTFYWQMATTS